MKINGVIISEKNLAKLTSVLPETLLREEYELNGLSDVEIAEKVGLSQSWVCKLRKIYSVQTDPNYGLRRNKLRFNTLTERQKEFLYGSLFGDSCISVQASGQGYWLCRHAIQQESYLLRKAEIMKPFTAKVFYGERAFEKGGELFKYVDARTYTHPAFTDLRKEFYPEGVKVLSTDLMLKMTPSGFAFWYFDDGSTTGYGFDITTYDPFFKTDEAIDAFRAILNLNVSIRWSSDGEGKIHVLKDSHDTAWEYVSKEIVSCFGYKIPRKYRTKDNQQPSLEGNLLEGSTTEGSLNSDEEHGDNTYFDSVTNHCMPETNELVGCDTV
jgi:hypothetical protein